jgi:hypothetical protein
MYDELERIWKEAVMAYLMLLCRRLWGVSGKNHENTHVPAEIRTEHLPNKSLGIYRYSNPLKHQFSGLRMEAACIFPEKSISAYKTARCQNPEGFSVKNRRNENLDPDVTLL